MSAREILKETGTETIAVSQTKLSEEFPDSQFLLVGVKFPAYQRDRNKHRGGLIVFDKKHLTTRSKKEL